MSRPVNLNTCNTAGGKHEQIDHGGVRQQLVREQQPARPRQRHRHHVEGRAVPAGCQDCVQQTGGQLESNRYVCISVRRETVV